MSHIKESLARKILKFWYQHRYCKIQKKNNQFLGINDANGISHKINDERNEKIILKVNKGDFKNRYESEIKNGFTVNTLSIPVITYGFYIINRMFAEIVKKKKI